MGLTIPVAHDFNCPWCWIGMHQVRRLRRDFGVTLDWRPYELYPDDLDLPADRAPIPAIPNRPDTPKRIELALAAEGLDPIDLSKDSAIRTHKAHEAVEFAKLHAVQDELLERIYVSYWREDGDIDSTKHLLTLAKGLIEDLEGLETALESRRFADNIVPFNKPAYETGVFNLPTFWIGDVRFAEQPYLVLAKALKGEIESAPYPSLDFPSAPADRPYVFINMVSTIDGKTVTGSREDGVMDLGSRIDHQAMRQIESAAEAVMIGAQTLRATPKVRFDSRLFRIVVSGSGDVDPTVRFFTDAPDRAIVASNRAPQGVRFWPLENMESLLRRIREELGVRRLLVEGGSELNASLLRQDLVDELFLTVAPRIRLGRNLPTYAGGEPLPRGELLGFRLVSERTAGDEVFLRYRRNR